MTSEKTNSQVKIRRSKPCPRKLAAIISDVNMLPPELRLLSFHDAAASLDSGSSEVVGLVKAEKALEKVLDHATEQAGVLVRDLILQLPSALNDDPAGALWDRIYRYEFFRVARLSLQSLARMNTMLRPRLKTRGVSEIEVSETVKAWFGDSFEPDEVARVRECPECGQIFWAGRIDKPCCGPRCNHNRQSRRTREKYGQGYYQGARLTEKEQTEQQRLRRKSKSARIKFKDPFD